MLDHCMRIAVELPHNSGGEETFGRNMLCYTMETPVVVPTGKKYCLWRQEGSFYFPEGLGYRICLRPGEF